MYFLLLLLQLSRIPVIERNVQSARALMDGKDYPSAIQLLTEAVEVRGREVNGEIREYYAVQFYVLYLHNIYELRLLKNTLVYCIPNTSSWYKL